MGNATVPAQNDDLIDDLVAAIRCARNLARELAGIRGHRKLTEIETVLDAALTRAQGDDPFDADARAARQVRESALKGPAAPAPTIGYWN
jgi:hypothetical protein